MSNVLFTSDRNYMKRDKSSGSDTMLGPNVSRLSGSFFTRDYAVDHNLGYQPIFRAYYEPFGDGKMFECQAINRDGLPNPPTATSGNHGPSAAVYVTTTQLIFRLFFVNSSLSGNSFPIYWVIYKDYGLE